MTRIIIRRIWSTGVILGSICYLLLVLYCLLGFFSPTGFALDSLIQAWVQMFQRN